MSFCRAGLFLTLFIRQIPESSSSEDKVEVNEAAIVSQNLRSATAVDSILCKKMIDTWRAWEFLV